MAFYDTIKDYRAAANQRLGDARELMETPTRDSERSDAEQRHLRGAMYLAGYAVECLLKAYLNSAGERAKVVGGYEKFEQAPHQ